MAAAPRMNWACVNDKKKTKKLEKNKVIEEDDSL